MHPVQILVLLGVLTVPSFVHAAVIAEEARRAMETQPLELEVDDLELALNRAEEWLTRTGHLPVAFGITYLIHEHKGPQLKRGKLVSSCRLFGDAPPRTIQPIALGNPAFRDLTLEPNDIANREMARILSRYIETGFSGCNTELTWLIDRPGHDPVRFDPVVYRQTPPTVDYRLCFDSIN